jgi:TRAP-type C4-dicarboxylate transport system permease small subunit
MGMRALFDATQRTIDSIVRWLIIALMTVMTVTVTMQILFRYVFNIPLGWSEEAARFAFVWVSFFGASALMRVREHINVTVFIERFPARLKTLCVLVANIGGLGCVYLFLVGGIDLTRNEWGQLAPAMEIPMGWVYLAIPISATLMAIWMILQTVQTLAELARGGPA